MIRLLMRKVLSCLALAVSAFVIWSCRPDEPLTPVDPAPKAITLSPESSSLDEAATEVNLTVTAPTRPVVSGVPGWISLVDGTFNKYQITYVLKVSANTTYEPRSATITVSSGTLSKSVTIFQKAA